MSILPYSRPIGELENDETIYVEIAHDLESDGDVTIPVTLSYFVQYVQMLRRFDLACRPGRVYPLIIFEIGLIPSKIKFSSPLFSYVGE